MQSSSAFVKTKTDWPLPSFKCPPLLLRESVGLSSLWSFENNSHVLTSVLDFLFCLFPTLVCLTTLFMLSVCWENFPSVVLYLGNSVLVLLCCFVLFEYQNFLGYSFLQFLVYSALHIFCKALGLVSELSPVHLPACLQTSALLTNAGTINWDTFNMLRA